MSLAGAEFGTHQRTFSNVHPGTFGKDYKYPTRRTVEYFAANGLGLLRIPFRWERLQPNLGQRLDATELKRIRQVVARAADCGAQIVLDTHNYGRYQLSLYGRPRSVVIDETVEGTIPVSGAAFADYWHRVAEAFAGDRTVVGLGLMNEPHDMGSSDKYQLDMLWWMGAQFAVGLNYERFAGGQFGLGPIEARKLPARKGELAFELPVRLDLGDVGPLDAVTEAIGPESLSLLLPEGHALTHPIRLEMATPFGDVNALADIAESKSRVLAGCDVREVRLRFQELTSDSRATLRATLSQHRSKELAPVIRSTPQRRPAESLRPMALVMGTTAVSAAVVLSCVLIFQQDEIALASA